MTEAVERGDFSVLSGRALRSEGKSTVAAHTPGPWRIFQTTGEPPFYIIGIGRETGEGITDANTGLGIWDADSPEALANARLIAAAPELLAEMKRYLPLLERMEAEPATWERLTVSLGIATANGYRAAIARATGGA